jgi:hypothetical protein
MLGWYGLSRISSAAVTVTLGCVSASGSELTHDPSHLPTEANIAAASDKRIDDDSYCSGFAEVPRGSLLLRGQGAIDVEPFRARRRGGCR